MSTQDEHPTPDPNMTRSASEVSLEEIERRYRTFIEQAPNIVIYADHPDQNSTSSYASPQIETILGVTPERWTEAQGTELWFSMLHPDDLERVQRQYADYLEGGPDVDDYRMIRPDGGVVWIRDRAKLVPDASGQLVEWGVMMDVTNMRGMEDRLREAEARYRTLVEQLPAFVYSEDNNGRVLYASPRSQEILGVSPDQWLNDPDLWRKMLVEEDRERALSWADRYEDVTQGYADEYRLRRPDGTVIWIRDEAVPVFDESGQFERWQGLMVDISEQKHAQELVRAAETKFRLLVEQIGAATYMELPGGPSVTTYISPQIEAMTGYTPEEWVADPELWEKCLHPEDRERSIAQALEANRTLEPYLNEHRMITRDGRTIWVRDEEHVVLDERGQPEYWMGVMVDVTQQREALQRLREAEAKFQVLVEEIPVITYVDSIGLEPGPRYISPQLESILGYPPERWLEDPAAWEKIVHPDDFDRQALIFTEADRTLEPYAFDYRALAADGRTVWLHEEAHVVRSEQGEPLYWMGAVQDVSARKETEELGRALAREKQATAKLRALDEMKDQFLAGISHDLRTPLASILGFTLTMEQSYHRLSDDQRLEFIGRITANARKLEELVNDLLDIHRLNQGVLVVQRTPTDVGALVEELVQHADYLADHAVEVDVASVVIPVDVTKVRRLVENLLTNTARHTPAGTHVWVRVTATPDGALVAIEDSGPGVPDEEKDELFNEFATGANTRGSSSPGIGVGLSLVARFAELHGGRAWVEDRVGGGAAFRVHLPANPPSS